MSWVAWRVQRAPAIALGLAVVLFGIWLAATALVMGHHATWKYWTDGDTYALYALPGVLGLALGAPIVAGEVGAGTNRLAWTQGISRRQWLTAKLVIGAVTVAVITGALTTLLEWWTSAISLAASTNAGGFSGVPIQPPTFDITGLVVVGYAVFAFALGAALGAGTRRAGWAFALGIPLFAAVRLVVQDWLRPGLVAPVVRTSLSGFNFGSLQNAWLLHAGVLPIGVTSPRGGAGWTTTLSQRFHACLTGSKALDSTVTEAHCALASGAHFVVQFQPADHYWTLQGAEMAIFVGIAAALLATTAFVVSRWEL